MPVPTAFCARVVAAVDAILFMHRWAQEGELDDELTEKDTAELRKAFDELDALPKNDRK